MPDQRVSSSTFAQRPTAVEIATGLLHGAVTEPCDLHHAGAPRATLEELIRPSLARPPCLVAFSGGRDSSALLAVSLALARREGWAEPIPVTLEFMSAATREREWQQRVLDRLAVSAWLRLPLTTELDLVGPVATAALARHGQLYPANAHMIVPLAQAAHGGSVLTGVGGDDVFGNWPWHDLAGLMNRRRPAHPRDIRRVIHASMPRRVRAEVLRRREDLALPWLLDEVRVRTTTRLAVECAAPPRWDLRMRWSARRRAWRATVASIELLGRAQGAVVCSPFLEPQFLAALGAAGGRWGWGDRTAAMRALFTDLLPESILARHGKAEFSEPLFGPETRRFARRWDGRTGIPTELADGEALREVWCGPRPHFLSAMALQSAWLASGDRRPQAVISGARC